MTSRTTGLIGLQDLMPEPCDGTGDDAMAIRARNKWHVGTQPARPRIKLLNPAVLANIASRATQKRLTVLRGPWADEVDEIYMLNKQFHQTVLRKLEACDTVQFSRWAAFLVRGPRTESQFLLRLRLSLFCAIREHSQLVFPKVIIEGGSAKLDELELTDIEQLELPAHWTSMSVTAARIMDSNADSLKVLKMPTSLCSALPPGLKLDEFIASTEPDKLEEPWKLDTKVFKREYRNGCGRVRMPPPFVRTANADEIHIEVYRIEPNAQEAPAREPSNSRVKKLVIDIGQVELNDFHLDRIVRDVIVMCPALECLEVVSRFRDIWLSALDYDDVDYLNKTYEDALMGCSAPFVLCLKTFFQNTVDSESEASDFARTRFNVDLPPACRVHEGREHYHLVKETIVDMKSLRMDYEIIVDPGFPPCRFRPAN